MAEFPGMDGVEFGVTSFDNMRDLSGLEFLQQIADGTLPAPPIGRTMGFLLREVKPGFALFTCTPTFDHYNPIGSVHGGLAGTLLDSCMSCAIQTLLPKGQGYTTLEYRVHLVRGMTDKTGLVRAEGKVVHAGRRISTAEGRIVDETGRLYAHGTTTCIALDL